MTERAIRQATRTYDGRDAGERIAQLEEENAALRAEVARLRDADAAQRALFIAQVAANMSANVREMR